MLTLVFLALRTPAVFRPLWPVAWPIAAPASRSASDDNMAGLVYVSFLYSERCLTSSYLSLVRVAKVIFSSKYLTSSPQRNSWRCATWDYIQLG
jgi:hypothetical protein